jgi:hypothetical protein
MVPWDVPASNIVPAASASPGSTAASGTDAEGGVVLSAAGSSAAGP